MTRFYRLLKVKANGLQLQVSVGNLRERKVSDVWSNTLTETKISQ